MPVLNLMTEADFARQHAESAAQFPGSHFGSLYDFDADALADFEAALADGREEALQVCLTKHPYLIQYALPESGHHGTWAFPKQMIRTTGADRSSGLIPDFLVAGRSSLGIRWFVVELKRPEFQFSNNKGDALSREANKAVDQCHRYLEHFSNYIETVRTNAQLPDIVQPRGAILIMGRSTEETEGQRAVRSRFCTQNPKIVVVSYDRILEGARYDLSLRVQRKRQSQSIPAS